VEEEERGRPTVVRKMSEKNSSPTSVEQAEGKVSPRIPRRSLMLDHGILDPHTLAHQFPGSGTDQDPYIVGWTANDPRNPLLFKDRRKWLWTLLVALANMAVALANMAVALATSAYTAPSKDLIRDFGISQEVFELGLSLFVLGFAVGPLFWAPLSELYGRQVVFVGTVSDIPRRRLRRRLSSTQWSPNTE